MDGKVLILYRCFIIALTLTHENTVNYDCATLCIGSTPNAYFVFAISRWSIKKVIAFYLSAYIPAATMFQNVMRRKSTSQI